MPDLIRKIRGEFYAEEKNSDLSHFFIIFSVLLYIFSYLGLCDPFLLRFLCRGYAERCRVFLDDL